MSKKSAKIVVVKKSKGHSGGGHHGGSWKIAYADFMTAMMAFFLVMWLLSNSSPQQRKQIADYFKTPVNIAVANGDKDSLSSNVIPGGGGDDMMKQDGEEFQHDINRDKDDLSDLQEKIEELIEVDPRLNAFKSNLLLRLTDSGLLIQIIDSQDRPMFKLGSKKPEEYMVHILQALTPVFNDIPNRLTLTGHTDSIPFANGEVGYSNWELSADRANESRQVLVNSGLHRDKVLQVIGMASNMGTDETQPDSALDRRMTILVVSKSKENQILLDDSIIRHVAIDENANRIQPPLNIVPEPAPAPITAPVSVPVPVPSASVSAPPSAPVSVPVPVSEPAPAPEQVTAPETAPAQNTTPDSN